MFFATRGVVLAVLYVELVNCYAAYLEGAASRLESHAVSSGREASPPQRKLMRAEEGADKLPASETTETFQPYPLKPAVKQVAKPPKGKLARGKRLASKGRKPVAETAAKKPVSKQVAQKDAAAKKKAAGQQSPASKTRKQSPALKNRKPVTKIAAKKPISKQAAQKDAASKRKAAAKKKTPSARKLPAKGGSQEPASKKPLAKKPKLEKEQPPELPARAEAEEEQRFKADMNRPARNSAAADAPPADQSVAAADAPPADQSVAMQADQSDATPDEKIPVAHPMESARVVWTTPKPTELSLASISQQPKSLEEKPIAGKEEKSALRQHEEEAQNPQLFPWKGTPVCEFGRDAKLSSLIRVFVNPDNTRAFVFDLDNHGSQTKLQCHGATPDACLRPDQDLLAKGKLQSCLKLNCACQPVTLSIDSLFSHYIQRMASHVGPICTASGGARILNIGLGGGAVATYLLEKCAKGTRIVSVEKDPRIIAMAARFFGFKAEEGRNKVENADASDSVAHQAARGLKYDVVLVDCFEAGGMIPESCRDWNFIDGLYKVLDKGGLVVQQVWVPQYKELVTMYKNVFTGNFVRVQPVDPNQNVLVLANKAKG
mmetsp:Transcript_25094/g.46157  ORF Transcript_25094/g.46157 Transcript_25094/m.46157 type:complete len:603 (+) Transcript_25094:63-1871(+)